MVLDETQLLKMIDSMLDEIADEIFTKSQELIVSKNIIDEGTLLKSGNIIRQPLNKEIVYGVPYAEEIEFGRTPGTLPPLNAIEDWVRRKRLVPNERAVKKFAYNIAKHIEEQGKEPRPFLTPAVENVKNKFS